jgi:GDP-4-dehydro-6-deoxy-D-mannose reductase
MRARAFNHLGPGQLPRFVAPALAERIARNELDGGTVVPVGNLSARRDFTDVRDVVRAYRLLAERGEPGEVYNVCSGRAVSVQQLAEDLLAMAHQPMDLKPDPALERPVDVPVLLGDYTRLRGATGWEPQIALEHTLRDLLDDMRARVRSGSTGGP